MSDDNSNWEDDYVSDDEPVKPQACDTKTSKKVAQEFVVPPELSRPLQDPDAERRRLTKINLLREQALTGNIFGAEISDEEDATSPAARAARVLQAAELGGKKLATSTPALPLESLSLMRLADIEKLCDILEPKIRSSPAKSPTWMRLFIRLLTVCASKMTPQDLRTLKQRFGSEEVARQKELNLQMVSSKKGSDLKPDLRNPRAELDIAAGLGFDDDDGSDDDDAGYYGDEAL